MSKPVRSGRHGRTDMESAGPSPLAARAHVISCRDDAQCQELGALLADRIYESNAKATGYFDGRLVAACVRDEAGEVIAGFDGHTWGGCCELSHVWVHERHRGRGLGTRLLRSAEAEAIARGCSQVVLATHSFQAPGFYERHGYERRYAIEGCPRGHADVIYVKALREDAGAALRSRDGGTASAG
jgi:GNAT superfamily N-acetyltransferase